MFELLYCSSLLQFILEGNCLLSRSGELVCLVFTPDIQSEEYGQCTHKIKSKVRYVHA